MTSPAHSERIQTLDILRGIALLGMILVHFHQKMEAPATMPEDLVGWIVWVGVEEKAWATFAFLFGVGFAILLQRREQRGEGFNAFYLRRLLGLAMFGILAEALFGFRVLLVYAIWGVPLLFVRKWRTRSLLTLAVLSAAALPVYQLGLALWQWKVVGHFTPPSAQRILLFQALEDAQHQPNYFVLVAARVHAMMASYLDWHVLIPAHDFALFILGLLAVRHGIFSETRSRRKIFVAFMVFGFVSWAAFWLLLPRLPLNFAPEQVTSPLRYGLGLVHDQWLAFTYVGAAVLLLNAFPLWQQRLSWLGVAGRMALTNYFVQIAVLDVLASSYGVGLKIRPYAEPLATALLFGAEVLLSRWWLARFRFGPLEWLWRSFTYGKLQPIRLSKPAAIAAGA